MDDKELGIKLDSLLENDHKHDLDLVAIKAQNIKQEEDLIEIKSSLKECVTNTEFSPFKNGILSGIGVILLAVLGAVVSLVIRK